MVLTVLSRKRPKIKIKNIKYISADISKTEDLKKKIKLNYGAHKSRG